MPQATPKCAKCGGPMEAGFLPGPANYLAYRMSISSEWFPGRPQATPNFSLGKSAKRARTVTTWRCATCGYLESYAK